MPIHDYERIKLLGRGGFGEVWGCRHINQHNLIEQFMGLFMPLSQTESPGIFTVEADGTWHPVDPPAQGDPDIMETAKQHLDASQILRKARRILTRRSTTLPYTAHWDS